MAGNAYSSRLIRFGTFEVDPKSGELFKQGRRIKLQGQPFEILNSLLKCPGELVTREELKDRLWPTEAAGDFDRGLNRAINRLREALGDAAESPRLIETVPRRGYRFIGTIQDPEKFDPQSPAAALETAPPPPPAAPPIERATVLRRPVILIATGLTLLALVLIWTVVNWRQVSQNRPSSAQIRSIAVLPLENLSNDPNEEFFADAMTDELITDLAKLPGLRVISRTSILPFKRKPTPLSEIASTLGVDAVIEGTVSRSNRKIRITSQLVQAREDRHLWAESYERDLTDVLDIQQEISTAIAREIQLVISPQSAARQANPLKVSAAAYDNYLKGRFFWDRRNETDIYGAIRYFERAIQLEPRYAAAYAGLADAYFSLCWDNDVLPPREAFPKGKAAALQALEIDPANSEAHASLSWVKLWYEWDWPGAENEAKAAIHANPNYATAHHHYARYLAIMGRFDEALRETQETMKLDPLGPIAGGSLAWNSYYARQYTTTVKQSLTMIEMYPSLPGFYAFLGLAKEQQGQIPDAIKAFEQAVEKNPALHADLAELGYAYALSGNRAKVREIIDRLTGRSRKAYVPAYDFALLYFGLRQDDEAFKWLEKAYVEHSHYLVPLNVDPKFDRLRSDPRFVGLLRRIGFGK